MTASPGVKIIAVIGLAVLLVPLVFMIVTSIAGSIAEKRFLMDYLATAELFPFILVGSLLLVFAAHRAHLYANAITAGLIAETATLLAIMLVSGKIKAEGASFVFAIVLIALYNAAVLVECVAGVLLCVKLLRAA